MLEVRGQRLEKVSNFLLLSFSKIMAQSFTTDDLKQYLTFPFEDEKWLTKFLISMGISFAGFIIPIVPIFFLYGYCAALAKEMIADGKQPFLPEWEEWGDFFMDGLRLFGVWFCYSLPGLILICGGMMFLIASSLSSIATLPPPNSGPDQAPPPEFFAIFFGNMMAGMGIYMFGSVIMFASMLVTPLGLLHVIAEDAFMAAFRFRELWSILQKNFVGFLVAYAITLGLSIMLMIGLQLIYMTLILCIFIPIIMPVVTTYLYLVGTAVFAQAYQQATTEGYNGEAGFIIASEIITGLAIDRLRQRLWTQSTCQLSLVYFSLSNGCNASTAMV